MTSSEFRVPPCLEHDTLIHSFILDYGETRKGLQYSNNDTLF